MNQTPNHHSPYNSPYDSIHINSEDLRNFGSSGIMGLIAKKKIDFVLYFSFFDHLLTPTCS